MNNVMSGYSVISDIGNVLLKILKENLCPDPIPNPETILLCSPFEEGDYFLSLHLYDIRENIYFKQVDLINMDYEKKQYPPLSLTLYYLLSLKSFSDFRTKASAEQKILGRVLQVLHDNQVLGVSTTSSTGRETNEPVRIELNNLSFDRKLKFWAYSNTPNRLSLFFTASPVFIDSSKAKPSSSTVDRNFLFRKNSL
ncbi:MAG: DUF4255 domain-containing protein [Clostridiaceae bacterium]|nr:DUF4255 domain-containing protein [Clostridiaceae bacterium]